MTSSVPPPLPSTIPPARRLVQRNVKLTPVRNEGGQAELLAEVQCERAKGVCDCLKCKRLVRVAPYPGGFRLLCEAAEDAHEPARDTGKSGA